MISQPDVIQQEFYYVKNLPWLPNYTNSRDDFIRLRLGVG